MHGGAVGEDGDFLIKILSDSKADDSRIKKADGKTVYNPTVKTIWFETESKLYKIDPDKTLKIN